MPRMIAFRVHIQLAVWALAADQLVPASGIVLAGDFAPQGLSRAAAHFPQAAAHHGKEKPVLFIGIVSSPGKMAQRKEIRRTWMQLPAVKNGVVTARFFIGQPSNTTRDQILREEANYHRDIVRLPVAEGYNFLSNKTLWLLKWFAAHRNEPYVMKLDDDAWPYLHKLVPLLRAETAEYSLLGHIFPCAPVLSFGKWSEKPSVYNQSFYPTYAQGSGYILSAKLVHRLLSKEQKLLHNEDASVGYWIQMERHADPAMDVSIRHLHSTLYGCKSGDFISMNLKPGGMACMHDKFKRKDEEICCGKKVSMLQKSTEAGIKQKKSFANQKWKYWQRCYGNRTRADAESEVLGDIQD